MKKAGFLALIKEVKVKSLVSGDKSVSILLYVDNPDDKLVAELDALQDPTRPVAVAIVEKKG